MKLDVSLPICAKDYPPGHPEGPRVNANARQARRRAHTRNRQARNDTLNERVGSAYERAVAAETITIERGARRVEETIERMAEAQEALHTMTETARVITTLLKVTVEHVKTVDTSLLGLLTRLTIDATPRQDRNATDKVERGPRVAEETPTVSSGYDGEPQPRYKDAIVWSRRLTKEAEALLATDCPWAEPLRSRCRDLLNRLRTYERLQIQALSELTPSPSAPLSVPLPKSELTHLMIEAIRETEVLVKQLAEVQGPMDSGETRPSSPSSSSGATSTMNPSAMSTWSTKITETIERRRAASLRSDSSLGRLATKVGRALSRSSEGKGKKNDEGKETEGA